ncbi:root phototropism protein 3 [Phtheirospermum japonicum]|uniref:Root phototropism protein 3 n=1 Tax=Phtheirospermum japonicum TaxID=374723 RepID=A0A830CG32_9LAMI|nr:root phototropism protein 3 [Phtheirospermum japonicum]
MTKKKFFIETIISILPPDRDCIPCNFMLRLLRAANTVRVEPVYVSDLEKRVSWQLDQASLEELMIPCFSHASTSTLLDVGLVFRLVRGFLDTEDVSRSGAAVVKVAKLVDCYLAEVAVDSYLALPVFFELASVMPSHARSTDDGLYRAVDTYIKAHPGLSKQDRKKLCGLIDTRKLSQEASHHAALNERMPVRAVLHLLLSEQTKLNKNIIHWSGSLSASRSPEGPTGPHQSARFHSKRETGPQQQQIMEIKRLKEDVLRLQSQCMEMERQIEKMTLEKKRSSSSGFILSWKKLGFSPAFKGKRIGEIDDEESEGGGKTTPFEMKARLVRGKNRRRSLS